MKLKLKFAVIFVFAVMLALASGADAAARYYVKAGGTGDGTSWANAGGNLQEFLEKLPDEGNDVEIWVAGGEYVGIFHLKKGVKLYGGFAGTENSLEGRDWKANKTTLNGNKSRNVVIGGENATPDDTRIDGFTITGAVPPQGAEYRDRINKGGGMKNDNSSPTVANCTFWQNIAEHGGGMYNEESSPLIINCYFSENTGNAFGGGILNYNSSAPTIKNCVFLNNIAGDSGQGSGGGIYNQNSSPIIEECSFSGNTAIIAGGGIANSGASSPTITNCVFSANSTVGSGGGISNSRSFLERGASEPVITNCVFEKNTAESGGGINNSASLTTITNCTFIENTAKHGGGILDFGNSKLTNCSFYKNTATSSGGGIYNSRDSESVIITNCTFSNNTSGEDGGGVSNRAAPTIINCTFSGNTAKRYGGGLNNFSASAVVVNTIFWGNTATDSGNDIYHWSSGKLTLKNCVITAGGFQQEKRRDVTVSNTGAIEADPKLIPTTNASGVFVYKLAAGSSAIDKGLAAGTAISDNAKVPDKDQLGTARPKGGGVDIGSFEF